MYLRILTVSLLLIVPALGWSNVKGFVEVRGHAYPGVDGDWWQIVERVRPEFTADLTERITFSTTVELGLSQGRRMQTELQRTLDASDIGPALELAGCEWPEEKNEVLGISSAQDYIRVERFFLDIYLPLVDLRLGRQALKWGSAFMVNPTDPFPEVLLVDPWRPRAGVNSLRATIPILEDHEIQLVLGSDDTFTNLRVAGRASTKFDLTDFSIVGAWRQETSDGIVGLDIRGTLELGFWLEGALHLGNDDIYEEIAVGLDYSFPVLEQMVITLQYYRNGGGEKEVDPGATTSGMTDAVEAPVCSGVSSDDLFGAPSVSSNPFAPFFKGRNYGMLSVMLGITTEISFSAFWVQNLNDGSGLIMPNIQFYLMEWLELSAAVQIPISLWGDGGELHPADEDLIVDINGSQIDMNGLVPEVSFILWTRVHL